MKEKHDGQYNQREIWDKIAKDAIKLQSERLTRQRKAEFYLTEAYVYTAKKALNYITKRKIKLLKTDLWNEAVDMERNILGRVLLKSKTIELYGIDISKKICQRAKKLDKRIKVSVGDIRSLPFLKDFLDVVLDLSTIDHIPQKDVPLAINEYRRVIKRGGILVLVFWQKDLVLRSLNLISLWIRKRALVDNKTQYAFSSRFVEEILNKKRFKIIKKTSIGTIFPLVAGWEKVMPVFEYLPRLFYKILLYLEFSNFSFLLPGRLKVIIAKKLS